MKKYAETLAREYDLDTAEDYYQIIVDSAINGQWSQVREQFSAMKKDSQKDFLINYLRDGNTIERSVRNICIDELL